MHESKQQYSTCLPAHLIKLGVYSTLHNLQILILQWSATIISIERVGRTRNYISVENTCIIESISKIGFVENGTFEQVEISICSSRVSFIAGNNALRALLWSGKQLS